MTPGSDRRGVSTVIGYVLLLGLTLASITAVVYLGSAAFTDLQQTARVNHASQAMTALDSSASTVALGRSPTQDVTLSNGGDGTVTVDEDAGHITIKVKDSGSPTTLIDEDYGAVRYEVGDTTVAYQGGGVWRHASGSTMISPPEFHYRDQTLTFPVVRVTSDSWSGSADNQLEIRRTGFSRIYPTTSLPNPLDNGHVLVKITSEYHQGWANYFESRTDGGVDHFPSNRTVMVNLTVPKTETFDNAVATTDSGSNAITTTGNAEFDSPMKTGVDRPSADPRIEDRISTCESGGCADLDSELDDDTLEAGTYYHDGDVTIGPASTYDTSGGPIHVVVNGDLTFTGSGGPGTPDHVVTGDGRVTFYVKGSLSIEGNAAVNTGGDTEDVVVFVHSDAGSVTAASGTPQFTGLIYAPGSSLTINGGGACGNSGGGGGPPHGVGGGSPSGCSGNIVGAVVVEDASANGNGKLAYEPPSGVALEFDVGTDITYLHVTENEIEVSTP